MNERLVTLLCYAGVILTGVFLTVMYAAPQHPA